MVYKHNNLRSCSPVLVVLAVGGLLVLIHLWYLSVQVSDISDYERAMAVGTASLWLGHETLKYIWVLVTSMLLIVWQGVIPGMFMFKRFLSLVFFYLAQVSILLAYFSPLILVLSLFYFSAAWEMNDLIYQVSRRNHDTQ